MLSQLVSISILSIAIVSLAAYNNGRHFCGNKHLQLILVDESMLVAFGQYITRLKLRLSNSRLPLSLAGVPLGAIDSEIRSPIYGEIEIIESNIDEVAPRVCRRSAHLLVGQILIFLSVYVLQVAPQAGLVRPISVSQRLRLN